MQELFNKNVDARLTLFYEKLGLESLSNFVQGKIKLFNQSFDFLSERSKNIEEKSNNLMKELNSLRQWLNLINKEWEEWKTKLILFKNYEGILRKAICKNTQNSEKELCEIKSKKEVSS